MMSSLCSLLLLAICQPVATFGVPVGGRSAAHVSLCSAAQRSPVPTAVYFQEESDQSEAEKALAKYVLLRPKMTFDELKRSTQTINFMNGRTPGTIRTVLLSSVLLTLFAIPAIVTNPRVLVWLIELAALDRAGVSPGFEQVVELFQQTGSF